MSSIPFSEFMRFALYDPVKGYYSKAPQIGKKGDFFTSVSVGSLFGQILAYQVVEAWKNLDFPEKMTLAEQGAHEGDLMLDILQELKLISPDCFRSLTILVVEPLLTLREKQIEKWKILNIPYVHYENWNQVEPHSLEGFFYSNELVDSFPVDLVTFEKGEWFEKRVQFLEVQDYQWVLEPIREEDRLFVEISKLPQIEGYTTEIHIGVNAWVHEFTCAWKRAVYLVVDYGYLASQYYSRERIQGTLQTYRGHQKGVDPLQNVGEQDITAHVNFSALAQAFRQNQASVFGFTDQNRYLTAMGEKWLCDFSQIHPHDSSLFMKKIREFKTLTHPEMMGSRFQVMSATLGDFEEKKWIGFRFGSIVGL